jgi:nitrogen fixation-related uncharacterized protein
MTMAALILLLGSLYAVALQAAPLIAIAFLWTIKNRQNETNRLLKQSIDLQRIRRDLTLLDAEQSKEGEGSDKGQGEIVRPEASYGDLSRVGLLKKPKP